MNKPHVWETHGGLHVRCDVHGNKNLQKDDHSMANEVGLEESLIRSFCHVSLTKRVSSTEPPGKLKSSIPVALEVFCGPDLCIRRCLCTCRVISDQTEHGYAASKGYQQGQCPNLEEDILELNIVQPSEQDLFLNMSSVLCMLTVSAQSNKYNDQRSMPWGYQAEPTYAKRNNTTGCMQVCN